jgi:N-acetylglucosamine-6-phosphate deacetylase
MTSNNGLICFTNCLLPQEDGSLIEKDLWIDEQRGVILDAQVPLVIVCMPLDADTLVQRTFYLRKERPNRKIDLQGNILR